MGGSERAMSKNIRSGISASALIRRGLRQPSHGLHGRPRATPQHQRPTWVTDLRISSVSELLWHPAVRAVYTNAPSAVVHLVMSLRPSHLVRNLARDDMCARARAIREHRWRHIEHLLFECPGISGLRGSLAVTLRRDDLFKACSGSDHAMALLLATFPSDRTPALVAKAYIVPFLIDPGALGHLPPPGV